MSNVKSQEDLANVLEYVGRDVLGYNKWYTLNQIRSLATGKKSLYRKFTIPKKSGGVRTIMAPCHDLKTVQDSLNKTFQAIYAPSRHAYGFVVGKSVADNAAYHIGQRYVFNIDLKDFFPSIEKRRIIARLISSPFFLPSGAALLIAGLSCARVGKDKKSVLPQGSPVSPVFSNIIAERLDRKLNKLANKYGARYSRYADDITFSSMNNIYRQEGDFYNEVWKVVAEEGFTINDSKVRINRIGERLEITGLTVSDKVNVARKYINDLRWMIYHWERDGYNNAYSVFIRKYTESKTAPVKGTPDMQNVIAGKLDYLRMIKGDDDGTYLKLKERFDALVNGVTVDRSISAVLDVWEKEGIDAAMEKYYSSKNSALSISEAIAAYNKYPRLEKYTLESFTGRYGVRISFKEIDGIIRAYVDDKQSFLGHPLYVTKGFDKSASDIMVELIQGNRARIFWYISNKRFGFSDNTPLNRIHFSVKPTEIEHKSKSVVEPKCNTVFVLDGSGFRKEEENKYIHEEYLLSGRLSYLWDSSLLSIDFIYPDSLSFCAIECVVKNHQTDDTKKVVITPRKMISASDIEKLKEYYSSGKIIEDIHVRIGKHDSSEEFGCPKWIGVEFTPKENAESEYFEPAGKKYTRIFKDDRISTPTVLSIDDFKVG